ncbi:Piezo-type mechanosensitive ion channel component 2 [Triplophysa tibetana]|uniref:Piezo-type mechanosensitive ion channel component 2 n=1 Tax=Triplophysa tibetana TaxID=1572043 RepID=A0A5A9P4Y5_9TELE|nr:Piezo-type mechanosensitive ion channel component 2 [Triplophysa tibetana]
MSGDIRVDLCFHVLLPLSLLIAILFRYNGLSVVYLLFLLSVPLVPSPNVAITKGKSVRFLHTVCSTAVIFLALQCGMQIPFSYLQKDVTGPWDNVFFHLGVVRFSDVDARNIIRLLMPDVTVFSSTLLILRLCSSKQSRDTKSTEQLMSDSEGSDEDTSDSESEDESRTSESSDEKKDPAALSSPPLLQKISVFLSTLRLLMSSLMNTAGKVLVTVLLGLSGVILPSMTSALYFAVFVCLVWCWVLAFSVPLLYFSSLCVMMTIFSGGHVLILYLYQLPLIQHTVPPQDVFARLFGLTALVRTNVSDPYVLALHEDGSWPAMLNPLLLLILYFTLIALLQRWTSAEPVVMMWRRNTWEDEDSLNSLMSEEHHSHHLSYDEEKDTTADDDECESSAAILLGDFIMKQSYIIALIIMMVWSITYKSWLTLVLLVWSCVIWMLKNRRRFAMLSAPFLAVYGTFLLVIAFISELHLNQNHVFPVLPKLVLMDFDVYGYPVPCTHLIAKGFYAFTFWMLLHQQLKEKKEERQLKSEECLTEIKVQACNNNPSSDMMTVFGSLIKGTLVKYWIFCCCFMFFIISFSDKVAVYKILYICLFLFCVVLYEVQYEMWRRVLKHFWMVVVAYSMTVLILIYVYQFKSVCSLFQQILGVSEERLRDFGLEQFDVVELFARILLPASFLLACILQLHYFNSDFLILTDLKTVPPANTTNSVSSVWACVMVVCKMMYQLKFIKPSVYSSNCTAALRQSSNVSWVDEKTSELLRISGLYTAPVDPGLWIGGLRKCDDRVLPCLWNHLFILGLLVFEVTVHRHQLHHHLQNGFKASHSSALIQGVTRQHLDHSILSCLKYFINYFFYKFGLEVCFVVAVFVIGQRMDVCALLHSLALMVVLARRRRKAIGEVWRKYCCFIAGFIVLQYLLCIGLPPALCVDYLWRTSSSALSSNLIKWLYLPDYAMTPDATFIMYDFQLLLVASLQLQVFVDENQAYIRLLAGENVEISRSLNPSALSQYSPVKNFLHCRSCLDMVKVVLFSHFFWLVLCLIFITGTTRINIFCLGYLMACFYFMLFGGTLLLQPVRHVLRLWDCLIAYTCVVISLKNLLSLGSCAYLDGLQVHGCWLIQAFSMFCTINGYNLPKADGECELPVGEAGIIWDAICFTGLLIQRRVFLSYYFLYVVSDLQISKILASRGAELFEAKVKKRVEARLEMEKKSVEVLKKQMEKIKSKQKKSFDESSDRPKQSDCGYHLFQSDSEEEEEETPVQTHEDTSTKKKSAFQLAYEAWVAGSKAALRDHQRQEETQETQHNDKRKLHRQKGCEREDSEEEEQEKLSFQEEEERDHILKRILDVVKFLWVFLVSLTEDIISGLKSVCKDSLDISKVLRFERALLSQQQKKGKDVTHDSIPQFYKNWLSRQNTEASLDTSPDVREKSSSSPPALSDMIKLNSVSSWHSSSVSSCQTDVTPLMTRQSTLDDVNAPDSTVVMKSTDDITNTDQTLEDGDVMSQDPDDTHEPMNDDAMRQEEWRNEDDLHEEKTEEIFDIPEMEESESFYSSLPCSVRLVFALYNMMESQSEMFCYFVMILNHMVSASLLSLFLPILIFLWAMLSVPRPTKRFWMSAIIYTQFGFFPWTTSAYRGINAERAFALPNIIGVEKKDGYVLLDLIQLIVLFFHRSILKCHGLWDNKEVEMPDFFKKLKMKTEKNKMTGGSRRREEKTSGRRRLAILPLQSSYTSFFQKQRGESTERHADEKLHKRRRSKKKRPEKAPLSRKDRMKQDINNRMLEAKAAVIELALHIYLPIRQFFYDIIHPEYSPVCDVYALMFLVDVANFIVIIFGYWAFGHGAAADITESLSEDQVPEAFLVMLLIQFSTMIVDRALYLRKTLLGKCVFQVVLVFGIHFWMFFILPGVTEG